MPFVTISFHFILFTAKSILVCLIIHTIKKKGVRFVIAYCQKKKQNAFFQ